jgi:2-amino-4-hydroxy-6-hydroxymethyldihydropteridine diphosphokinase
VAKVHIGLGANLGDRERNIRRALALLNEMNVARVKRVSRLIETEPVGGPEGQGMYLNGAAEIETDLSPYDLLEALKTIEVSVGRMERERWAPREIDLDILLYENEIVRAPTLEIPHPRMCQREFVLRPLAEIAPGLVHPVTLMLIVQHLELLRRSDAKV